MSDQTTMTRPSPAPAPDRLEPEDAAGVTPEQAAAAAGAATDAWPDWVVTDVEGRLQRLRHLLEACAARAARSSDGGADGRWRASAPTTARLAGPGTGASGFDLVTRLFELSPFEEDVLVLALAPEVDGSFGELFAAAQGDTRRRYPTPHLALDLLAGAFAERLVARRSFLEGSPLVRSRLIRLDEPGSPGATASEAALRLEPRIAALLLGMDRPDDEVRLSLERLGPGPLGSTDRALVDELESSLRPLLARHPRPLLNLVGQAGSGRHILAQALCARLGLGLYRLDLAALPGEPTERRSLLRAIDRDAVLSAFALYVDAATSADRPDVLADVVRDRDCLVIVGGATPLTRTSSSLLVEVPAPDACATVERWCAALGTRFPTGEDALDLAEQFAFGPRTIQRAATAALRQAAADGRALTTDDLVGASRREAGSDMDDLARRLEPRYDWDDIVLPIDLAGQLREIAGQVGHRFQVYERWGFGTKLARGRGITVLFAGPSGTGKTMAAEVLANDLGLDLYRIDLAGVVSKYIGETEKNLRRLFDAAERTGCVLFFDEADALFGKRTEVRDSHDRYANIEINYLLQRMEDYRGLAILATNMRSLLDHAFLRRLRFILDFPFPDRASRRDIWERVFPPEAGADIDPDALSRLEIAGGSIRSIAVNAAFFAAQDGTPIGMGHVMRAARREYTKIDKLVIESEFHPRPGAAA